MSHEEVGEALQRIVRTSRGRVDVDLVDVFVDLHGQTACYGHGLPAEVTIDSPSSAAGTYGAAGATFGPGPSEEGLAGDVVPVTDGSANPTLGCGPLIGFPAGTVALVDRGSCTFCRRPGTPRRPGPSR